MISDQIPIYMQALKMRMFLFLVACVSRSVILMTVEPVVQQMSLHLLEIFDSDHVVVPCWN